MQEAEIDVKRVRDLSIERLKISEKIKELELQAAKLDGELVASGVKLADLAYR
ncbi:MAG: hypothetical protein QNJ09_02410 [Paracoccaceae bacterium]|nr:hypothetical protein [Paracoccaceae bacterium]